MTPRRRKSRAARRRRYQSDPGERASLGHVRRWMKAIERKRVRLIMIPDEDSFSIYEWDAARKKAKELLSRPGWGAPVRTKDGWHQP